MSKKKLYLLYGCLFTLAILVLLFIIKVNCPTLLDIDIKWLGLAILPLVLALVLSGYISKFSGFGVDIEIRAKETLIHNPSVINYFQISIPVEKSELGAVSGKSEYERNLYNVLFFKDYKREYYMPFVVEEYLRVLKNVSFFEIIDRKNTFVALARINRQEIINRENTQDNTKGFVNYFINNLNSTSNFLGDSNITKDYVYENTTVIEALQKIKRGRKDFIAVLNIEHKLIGVVYKTKLEECLANAVLDSIEKEEVN